MRSALFCGPIRDSRRWIRESLGLEPGACIESDQFDIKLERFPGQRVVHVDGGFRFGSVYFNHLGESVHPLLLAHTPVLVGEMAQCARTTIYELCVPQKLRA